MYVDDKTPSTDELAARREQALKNQMDLEKTRDEEKRPLVDQLNALTRLVKDIDSKHKLAIEVQKDTVTELSRQINVAEMERKNADALSRVDANSTVDRDHIMDLLRLKTGRDSSLRDAIQFSSDVRGNKGLAKTNGLSIVLIQNESGDRKSYLAFSGTKCVAYQETANQGAYRGFNTIAAFAVDIETDRYGRPYLLQAGKKDQHVKFRQFLAILKEQVTSEMVEQCKGLDLTEKEHRALFVLSAVSRVPYYP